MSLKRESQSQISDEEISKKCKLEKSFDSQDLSFISFNQRETFSNNDSSTLPIEEYREKIISIVNSNRIVIVCGDTGCGKSTQVPKYLLQSNESPKIICTQPRKLAAKNLARRVSEEIKTPLGSMVGYQVGLDSRRNKETKLTYMTNGIFLQELIHNPDNLSEISHIILDEIHERDIDSDFIMFALKHEMKKIENFKLILMSATINSELFANYFSFLEIETVLDIKISLAPKKEEELNSEIYDPGFQASNKLNLSNMNAEEVRKMKEWGNWFGNPSNTNETFRLLENDTAAPVISIPKKRKFTIKEYYIDTIEEFLEFPLKKEIPHFFKEKASFEMKVIEIATIVVQHILRSDKYQESILVFLPGLNEIDTFSDFLDENISSKTPFTVIKLHSALPDVNNNLLFEKPQNGKRKIILSTNVAESSITVPDVVYVIDFCMVKELNFNPYTQLERLELTWASMASCLQRKGRTGRVSDGISIKLVPSSFYNDFLFKYSKPEIQRCSLDKLILKLKTLAETDTYKIFSNPVNVLNKAIQPPDITKVGLAFLSLQESGAISLLKDNNYESSKITFLGRIYCDLPCEIKFGKMCLMGLALNCLYEAVTLVAILQQQRPIFKMFYGRYTLEELSEFIGILFNFSNGSNSDHIILLNVFFEWETKFKACYRRLGNTRNLPRPSKEEREWCKKYYFDPFVLRDAYQSREDIVRRLKSKQLLPSNIASLETRLNLKEEKNIDRIKILITSSFPQHLIKSNPKGTNLETTTIEMLKLKNKNPLKSICFNTMTYNTDVKLEVSRDTYYEFLSKYGTIEDLSRIENLVVATFTDSTYEKAVKKLYTVGSRLASLNIQNQGNEKKFAISKEMKILDSFGQVEYHSIGFCSDLLSYKNVKMDETSINFISINKNENEEFYCASEYFDRNNCIRPKYVTKLPNHNFIGYICMLIFGACPVIKVDEEKRRYSTVLIQGSNLELPFNLTYKDIDEINQLRSYIRQGLTQDAMIRSANDEIFEKILETISKPRIHYFRKEKWEDEFFKLFYEDEINQRKLINMKSNISFLKKIPQKIKIMEKLKGNSYLSDITKPPLENCIFDLSKEEGITFYKEYLRGYWNWKKEILLNIRKNIEILNTSSAFLACNRCNEQITSTKNIHELIKEEFRRITASSFLVYRYSNNEDIFCNNKRFYQLQDVFVTGYELFGCRNNHVFLMKPKGQESNDYYLTEFSNVCIIYPDLKTKEKFMFYSYSYKEKLEMEKTIIREKEKFISSLVVCKICNLEFQGMKNFSLHCSRDKGHQMNLKEFNQVLDFPKE